jgi:hypothetical protein
MGLAADMAELLVLGFVLPSAEVDFCISKTQTRIIGESSIRFFFGPTNGFDWDPSANNKRCRSTDSANRSKR